MLPEVAGEPGKLQLRLEAARTASELATKHHRPQGWILGTKWILSPSVIFLHYLLSKYYVAE